MIHDDIFTTICHRAIRTKNQNISGLDTVYGSFLKWGVPPIHPKLDKFSIEPTVRFWESPPPKGTRCRK